MARTAVSERKTFETEVFVRVDLDGSGHSEIATTVPFFDHMLTLFSRHSLIDVTVTGRGDTDVDDHHLIEDIGICLGEAVKSALGSKEGIRRYGEAAVPMDESLCTTAVDISGRPYLVYQADFAGKKTGLFDLALMEEFFKAFSDNGGITLHVHLHYGNNAHHMAEAVFKAFALAMRRAVSRDERRDGVPSTKGRL